LCDATGGGTQITRSPDHPITRFSAATLREKQGLKNRAALSHIALYASADSGRAGKNAAQIFHDARKKMEAPGDHAPAK